MSELSGVQEKPGSTNSHKHVEIKVNNQPVQMATAPATGAQIIDAAIAQGVKIQVDFVLSLEIGHDKYRIIGKDETVELHSGDKFIANTPDDNA